jgi:hypothetical protein
MMNRGWPIRGLRSVHRVADGTRCVLGGARRCRAEHRGNQQCEDQIDEQRSQHRPACDSHDALLPAISTAHMRHPGVRRRQRSGVESILVAATPPAAGTATLVAVLPASSIRSGPPAALSERAPAGLRRRVRDPAIPGRPVESDVSPGDAGRRRRRRAGARRVSAATTPVTGRHRGALTFPRQASTRACNLLPRSCNLWH